MKPRVAMREALADPALLGSAMPGDSWQPWRVLLIAMMGEALLEDERPIFAKLTGRDHEPGQRVEEFWAAIGRRGGKSRAFAVLIVYVTCLVDHSDNLSIGETPIALCLAQNQRQAAVIFGYCRGILESIEIFRPSVTSTTADTISLANGVDIQIRAASFRGLRGITCILVVADEIAFWRSDASLNPDAEIVAALRPSLATTGGLLAAISSPYSRRGELYATWREHYGAAGDPLILVAQGASRDLNPSLPQKVVDRAYERDPASASAEFGGLFRSDLEAFVSREAVEACVSSGILERPYSAGLIYHAFVDPSGGSSDSMTLAIAHGEGDEAIVLDLVRERKAPFSPEDAVAEFAETLKAYGLSKVTGDRYAGEWPRERFRRSGIEYWLADKTKSEIYVAVLPLINSRRANLLDDKRLVAQLIGLERRTTRGGRDTVDHPPGWHDDVVNAASGAMVLAEQPLRTPRAVFGTYGRSDSPFTPANTGLFGVQGGPLRGVELRANMSIETARQLGLLQ